MFSDVWDSLPQSLQTALCGEKLEGPSSFCWLLENPESLDEASGVVKQLIGGLNVDVCTKYAGQLLSLVQASNDAAQARNRALAEFCSSEQAHEFVCGLHGHAVLAPVATVKPMRQSGKKDRVRKHRKPKQVLQDDSDMSKWSMT